MIICKSHTLLFDPRQYTSAATEELEVKLNKLFNKLNGIAQSQSSGSGGLVYTRWGRTTCPRTQLVYAGRAGGTFYNQEGGEANYLCMPLTPDYVLPHHSGIRGHAYVYGAEYKGPIRGGHDLGVPCSVCYTNKRETALMIPAKAYCPSGWTREYYGYLMTEALGNLYPNDTRCRTMFECMC